MAAEAVAALTEAWINSRPTEHHSQLCPVWTQRLNAYHDPCDCFVMTAAPNIAANILDHLPAGWLLTSPTTPPAVDPAEPVTPPFDDGRIHAFTQGYNDGFRNGQRQAVQHRDALFQANIAAQQDENRKAWAEIAALREWVVAYLDNDGSNGTYDAAAMIAARKRLRALLDKP
jgi:hypothetical protein